MSRTSTTISALVIGAALLVASAQPASADTYEGTSYCGTQYSGASPAQNPFAALNDMSTSFYDEALERSGISSDYCGAYHTVIEAGAKWVATGTTLGPLRAPVSKGMTAYEVGQMASEAWEGAGAESMEVASSAAPTYPIAWTGGVGLWLRGGPGGDSSRLFVIPEGTQLAIQCQARGEAISNGYQTTDLWSRVTVEDPSGVKVTGMVSDAFVDTQTLEQVAPTC